jgi:hypothetical protein
MTTTIESSNFESFKLAPLSPTPQNVVLEQRDTENAKDPRAVNERRLVRKIDWHLVPPLCCLYLLAFLDRVNIANAKLYSLEKDLGLTGSQYNIALVMFFVPYVVFEIPANLLLKKLRPSIWRTSPPFPFQTLVNKV